MATTPIQYNPYNPAMNYSSSDPRQLAKNNLQSIAGQGQQLYDQNDELLNQGQQQQQQTQDYLGNIEDPLAQGKGGYNAQEVSQIEMTPEQQQSIITGAGISAGANTAAATDAANRQFNATGGNPAAMAAYRQREALQQGAQAGDAMTQARIGAQEAGSQEAQTVGNARLGQQSQGLNYYTGLQQQENQNVQNAAERDQQTYGTASGAGNGATSTAVGASQTPSTFDKVISGVSSFLEDGGAELGHEVVVGEGNNPERIVSSNYQRMSDQGQPSMAEDGDAGDSGWSDSSGMTPDPAQMPGATPWWQKLGAQLKGQAGTSPMGGSSTGNKPQQSSWNPTTPYSQLGAGAGKLAMMFLEDGGIMPSFSEDGTYLANGGMEEIHPPTHGYGPGRSYGGGMPQGANGIFTKPTRVALQPGDKVVPLTQRPYAKVRPSAAFGQSGVRM